jgi:hypothetical protein
MTANTADICTGYYFSSNNSDDVADEGETDSTDEGLFIVFCFVG